MGPVQGVRDCAHRERMFQVGRTGSHVCTPLTGMRIGEGLSPSVCFVLGFLGISDRS